MLIRSTWGRYGGNTVVLPGHYRWNTLGAPGRHGTGGAGKGLGAVCCIVTLGAQPGNVTNGSKGLHADRVPGRLPDVPGLAWKWTGFTSAGSGRERTRMSALRSCRGDGLRKIQDARTKQAEARWHQKTSRAARPCASIKKYKKRC